MSDTLRCRLAAPGDIDAAARLAAHSFPAAPVPPDGWRDYLAHPRFGGGAGSLVVGDVGGRTVAMLQIHPLRLHVSGAVFPCAGVGTVAISPTHRKHGHGAELVTQALRLARERGDTLSLLYPFRTEFYRRLGYGISGRIEQWQVPPEFLPRSDARKRVELVEDDAGLRDVHELYARWAPTQNGQLARTDAMWAKVLEPAQKALVAFRDDGGVMRGYALVIYLVDGAPGQRYASVEELVWETDEARDALLGWLASLGDQWRQIILRTLPSHRLVDRLAEPRLPRGGAPNWRLWEPAATLLLGTMARVVDMGRAWQSRTIAGDVDFAIDVHDAQIPENAGIWRITSSGGNTDVARSSNSEGVLRMDVSTLARLFTGALAPTHAYSAGLLECDRPERLSALDAALALPDPWTFDRF